MDPHPNSLDGYFSVNEKNDENMKVTKKVKFFMYVVVIMIIAVLSLVIISLLWLSDIRSFDESSYIRVQNIGAPIIQQVCNFAIIGAGMGGTFTANRLAMTLKETNPDAIVCLFEAANFVGGRTQTRFFDGAQDVAMEIGGMRYLPHHRIVADLAAQYNLSSVQLINYQRGNFYFLRNQRINSPLNWNFSAQTYPYNYLASERNYLDSQFENRNPLLFLLSVASRTGLNVSNIANMDYCEWEEWRQTARYNNISLQDIGFQQLVTLMYSQEVFATIQDWIGYQKPFQQLNAASMIYNFLSDFYPNCTYWRLERGYQALAETIYQEFINTNQGLAFLNYQLLRTEQIQNQRLLLTFTNSGSIKYVITDHIIYTITQPNFVDLTSIGPGYDLKNPTLQSTLDLLSVTPINAFKLFLGFPTAWWEQYGFQRGALHTSGPIKQMIYWGVQNETQKGAGTSNSNSIVLATYSDTDQAEYWESLLEIGADPQNGLPSDPIASGESDPNTIGTVFYLQDNPYLSPESRASIISSNSPSARLVNEMMREIRAAHMDPSDESPPIVIPDPYAGVYANWVKSFSKTAYHFWKIGRRSDGIRNRLRTFAAGGQLYSIRSNGVTSGSKSSFLLKKSNTFTTNSLSFYFPPVGGVYLCGETYSDEQGWVEGAFRNCEKMLIEVFQMNSIYNDYLSCA